jgi:hypothetical protein
MRRIFKHSGQPVHLKLEVVMGKAYTELVIAGPFALVKGFLMGFRYGSETEFGYFFHRKSGIRRDTLAELVKEALEMDNYVHLCLENDVLERFRKAVGKTRPEIGLEIKNERLIKEAHFDFSFDISNSEAAKNVKQILENLPPSLILEGYEPHEEIHPEEEKSKIGGYAPLHPYTFKGSGRISGDFGAVMELFLKAKRMPESGLVLLSEIALSFGE